MPNLKLNNGRTGSFKSNLVRSPKVTVGATSYGYGVYCNSPIKRGEVIEECVLLADRIPFGNRALQNYVFRGVQVGIRPDGKPAYDKVVPSGIGALVNHSTNNANIDIAQNPNFERILTIFAIKDILPGQELFWNYGYQPK